MYVVRDHVVFLEAVSNYLHTVCVCIPQIISFVTDVWAKFIVFVLPEEVKVTPYLEKKRASTTCEQKYEILVGLSICLGNIWNMFQLFGEKCPPLWAR